MQDDVASRTGLRFWEKTTSAGHRVTGYHSEPSGRPVIHFLHGNGYNGLVYWPLLRRLGEHYDLFISDIQGHGESEANGRFKGWNQTSLLCEEVWRDFRHLWPEQPHYGMGHSFGGIMTTFMMARDPALFSRAVLLDPIIFSKRMLLMMRVGTFLGLWHRNGFAQKTRQRRSHWPDRQTAYESLEGRGMFKGWEPEALQSYVDFALKDTGEGVGLKCPAELEAQIFSGFPRGLWRTLKQVRTPTHVIYGERTYDFVQDSVARWGAFNELVSVEQVPGGHCFMQQSPEDTTQRVLKALG